MSRLTRAWAELTGRPAVHTLPAPPDQPEGRSLSYQDVWGTGSTDDLLPPGTAGGLSLVPLFSAVRLIADQFASTPLHGVRLDVAGNAQQLERDPQLLTPANKSRATWKTECIMGLLTQGNAVGLHTAYGADSWPTATMWLDPQQVTCDDNDPWNVSYWWMGRRLIPGEFVHIPWLTLPGRTWGLSPMKMFKTLWETGQAAQQLSRNFYDSGGVPSGHLKNSEQELDETEADAVKVKFRQAVAQRDVLVTGSDWDYSAIGMPADELAFVQALKMTATQIAGIYGIAPEDIGGEAAAGLQYSTVEMNQIKLTSRTMMPWYDRVQDGLEQTVPRGQGFRFDADKLVKADLKSRMEAHKLALDTGLETNPEGRRAENRAPLTDQERADWLATYRPTPQAAVKTRGELL